ncbi:MAG: OsmC family protein [Bacteroidetes bacterium]|nr:OsmC family protein [Bacteroidota bacterium]MBS1934697.1 OsmC family protein [Bacteroidota bacterium]
MKISATIKSKMNELETTVRTNDAAKQISISPKATGLGSSINGGELLLLSLATCFCNDIYREAAKRSITVHDVDVIVTADFGAEGEPGSNFKYTTKIKADATPEEIQSLIEDTDKVAEIHNTLRKGIDITIGE